MCDVGPLFLIVYSAVILSLTTQVWKQMWIRGYYNQGRQTEKAIIVLIMVTGGQ